MTVQRVTTTPKPPRRPADGHKGTFGRVLIVAGSRGMSGAAALCGLGALRGGAGLVTLATPESTAAIAASLEPSYMTLPLAEDEQGAVRASALRSIREAVAGKHALAVGPGMGSSAAARKIITTLYQETPAPMVLDADGLNAFANDAAALSSHAAPRVLTPHPGEFARLTGEKIDVDARVDSAVRFAAAHNIVVVLKGPGTVVTDGRCYSINTTGNSGMGTGGSGDVLTGLITALLALGTLSPFEAARFGVYLHGLAGDLCAKELSQPGMIASDLVRFLPAAWNAVLN